MIAEPAKFCLNLTSVAADGVAPIDCRQAVARPATRVAGAKNVTIRGKRRRRGNIDNCLLESEPGASLRRHER